MQRLLCLTTVNDLIETQNVFNSQHCLDSEMKDAAHGTN